MYVKNNVLKTFCCFVFLNFVLLPFLYADPPASVSHGVMIQGFGWNSTHGGEQGNWYKLIEERANSLKALGVNFIWFPPVSRSVSQQGYLPGDYYDLGTEQNPTFYGTESQLRKTLKTLNDRGIAPIADIVINHRCAGKQDNNGVWNIYHFPSGKAQWEQWAICQGQYGGTGNKDSGESYHAAPDVDHTNRTVQKDIIQWLRWMKSVGFRGWRYDYSKGYASKYAGMYDINSSPIFSVGEIWTNMSYQGSNPDPNQDFHRQILCNWLDSNPSKVATLFDFTGKGILQTAIHGEYWRLRDSKGKASGLIGWWPTRAVTFLDNHDTGSEQNHWPFPSDKVMQGYAYILTHPGIPCLFWEHVYDWNLYEPLQTLIKIRKSNKINSGSELKIVKAEQGLYAAIVDDKVAIKLGWKDWAPSADFKLQTSGDQYAIWAK